MGHYLATLVDNVVVGLHASNLAGNLCVAAYGHHVDDLAFQRQPHLVDDGSVYGFGRRAAKAHVADFVGVVAGFHAQVVGLFLLVGAGIAHYKCATAENALEGLAACRGIDGNGDTGWNMAAPHEEGQRTGAGFARFVVGRYDDGGGGIDQRVVFEYCLLHVCVVLGDRL